MMTLTLELKPDQEILLREQAEAHQLPISEFVQALLNDTLQKQRNAAAVTVLASF